MNAKWTKPYSDRVRLLGSALAVVEPSDETKRIRQLTTALHTVVAAEAPRSAVALLDDIGDLAKELDVKGTLDIIVVDLVEAATRVRNMVTRGVSEVA